MAQTQSYGHVQERSDDTAVSMASSLMRAAQTASSWVELYRPYKEDHESAVQALKRMLSINSQKSFISTHSALAVEEDNAMYDEEVIVKQIGAGVCAEVFTKVGSGRVMKRQLNATSKDLQIDCKMHVEVLAAFQVQIGKTVQVFVPAVHDFITTQNTKWWQTDGASLPPTPERRPVLITERIYPLPQIIRLHLIETFCDPKQKLEAIQNPDNQDALARVYLGMRSARGVYPPDFSLRNFQLDVEKLDFLGASVLNLAGLMGEAMAIIHWQARIDGRDIEFVLGSAPATTERKIWTSNDLDTELVHTAQRRLVKLWVLDFNQCSELKKGAAGVEQAAAALVENDPYFPKSNSKQNPQLWEAFETKYLARAEQIFAKLSEDLTEEAKRRPAAFIARVKEKHKEKFPAGSGDITTPPPGPSKPRPPPPPGGSQSRPGSRRKRGGGRGGGSRSSIDLDALAQTLP